MILKENLFPIGQLVKTHGIHGELVFDFTTDVFHREEIGCFILEINGIFVPFFVNSSRVKSSEAALIKFDDIDTDIQARDLIGATVYLEKKYMDVVDDAEIELDYFVGFRLIDENMGEIGLVDEVDQTTENALFIINKGDDELLIPVGDDYVTEIDHEAKILYLSLPEGLLDL